MQYLLCPLCFNDLLPSIRSDLNTISCPFCKNIFHKKLCILDKDIIIPIIAQKSTKELLFYILNITINKIEYSHSKILKIECVDFHLDECCALDLEFRSQMDKIRVLTSKLSESKITSVGDYNTSVKYKFTKKRFISSNFNVVFVFGRGAGLWCADYVSYNYLKYAKKVIIMPSDTMTSVSIFANAFRSLNALREWEKLLIPSAILSTSPLADNLLSMMKTEFCDWTTLLYDEDTRQDNTTDYFPLIKWITGR